MSDFPKKAADKVNTLAVVAIGLSMTAVLWASVLAMQAFFMNTEGEISAKRASLGRATIVRDLKADHRAELATTTFSDPQKGTLKRLAIKHAKRAVIHGAQNKEKSLIPRLGALNVPTINLAGASLEELAAASEKKGASGDSAESSNSETQKLDDRDNDTVADTRDNCPDDAGTAEFFGCKEAQHVKIDDAGNLVLLKNVEYVPAKAEIRPEGRKVLDHVAGVLNNHNEIKKIQISGRAYESGKKRRLGRARSLALVRYLVKQNVNPSRFDMTRMNKATPVIGDDGKTSKSNIGSVKLILIPESAEASLPAESKVRQGSR